MYIPHTLVTFIAVYRGDTAIYYSVHRPFCLYKYLQKDVYFFIVLNSDTFLRVGFLWTREDHYRIPGRNCTFWELKTQNVKSSGQGMYPNPSVHTASSVVGVHSMAYWTYEEKNSCSLIFFKTFLPHHITINDFTIL